MRVGTSEGSLPPGEGFSLSRRPATSISTAQKSQAGASGRASPLQSIAISRYNAATFDLIRSGLSRTTFPSRGRLWSVLRRKPLPPLIRHAFGVPPSPRGRLSPGPFGLMILFPGENCNTQFTVHKLPRNSLQIVHLISRKPTIIREKRKKTGGIPYGRFRIDR